MRTRLVFFGLVFVALVGIVSATAVAKQDELVKALEVADNWLDLLDKKEYAKCLSMAAPIFQKSTTLKKWEAALKKVEDRFGTVINRRIVEVRAANKLPPNSPEGKYFVITYATVFKKGKYGERLTMMLEKDGNWGVAGYYVF